MKVNVLKGLFALLFVGMFVSCSSDEEKLAEFEEIARSRSTEILLNDLYVASDGDIEALARVLKATPSSIERLRKGETKPTPAFEERIIEASVYFMQNDQNFNQLRSILDEEYAWYEYVVHFPGKNITLSIVIVIILSIASIFVFGLPIIAAFLFYIVAWVISLCCSPEQIKDIYTDSINPTIEQLK
ncbi:MAG: hypothetical protein UIG52_03640 [Bacteroidales bacterium]|nr:hypothetical protein [Bacteroidales bacterium]MEE0937104.1 hypothetical protein [Bacteroidales bacterium]